MEEMNTIQSLNPWTSLWLKPRQTIRQIVDTNPTLHVIPIMFVMGVLGSITPNDLENNFFRTNPLLSEIPFPLLVLGGLILGGITSIIFLYVNAWLLKWTGNWLNGVASHQQLRSATAWSSIPMLLHILIWLPFPFIFGSGFGWDMVTNYSTILESGNITGLVLSIAMMTTIIILEIWAIVICCHMIGEVQEFLIWTALWNYILSFLIIIIPIALIAALFGMMSAIFTG